MVRLSVDVDSVLINHIVNLCFLFFQCLDRSIPLMKNYADLLVSVKEKGFFMHAEKNLTQILKLLMKMIIIRLASFNKT